ncbi:hypothetical protein PSHT_01857 [Puccinia striiformis]|uniref:MINDY deubiquitinase domain-containing protein n=1 Tax=Puccinia striiformis TaxID=27350 RepID=A0A2S4WJR9_9BASI|nr:hypothetical protein PSHT_01857 [Puccinia striiformis]
MNEAGEQEQEEQKTTTTDISQENNSHLPTATNDQRWWIKQILWPPFPNQTNPNRPRRVSILMQNSNGPCSLLAICNVLLLRGSIHLPEQGTSISFTSLLSILADYLVNQKLEPAQLDTALATIPTTQTGLDLNPRFASIDGFSNPSSSSSNGIDLFSAVGIQLVHGWIADHQDFDTWDVLVGKCGDYDSTLELVVSAEELISKQPTQLTQEERNLLREGQQSSFILDSFSTSISPSHIQTALLARKFLDTTSTQLSYPGLFQLSTGIAADSLVALLRNSHLSVLYRRPLIPTTPAPPPLPPPPDQTDPDYDHQTALEVHAITQELDHQPSSFDHPGLPKLFTLVTDLAFLNHPNIVWESLEDVEGGLSEFYDWKLTRTRLKTTHHQACSSSGSDNDANLAHQLQEDEYRRARVPPPQQQQQQEPDPHQSGNTTTNTSTPVMPSHPTVPHPSPTKKKKKDCVIV